MSVWIVDDETNLANGLKRAFERKGTASNASEASRSFTTR